MADPKTKSHKVKTTTNNEKVFYKEKCERLKLEKQKQMDLRVWALKRKKNGLKPGTGRRKNRTKQKYENYLT